MQAGGSADSGRIRVLGVGNVLMGDDAFGPRVAQELLSRYEFPEAVEVHDAGTPGLDFLPFISNARSVIIIDTVHSDGPPGTVKVYRDEELLATPPPPRMSPHQPGIREALMATELTDTSPGEVVIVGVVPETVATRTRLSGPLQHVVDDVVAVVLAELRRLGNEARERERPLPLDIWWEQDDGGSGGR